MRILEACVGLVCCLSVCAAQPGRRRVYLDISVTDPSGKPASGLSQTDFAVEDNHHPQSLSTFQEVSGGTLGETAHAVLLLDAVDDKSSGELEKQVKAVAQFLAGASGPLDYPMSIALLSESAYVASESSRDRNQLLRDLRRFASGVHVEDCANEDADTPDNAGEAPMITEMNGDSLDRMEGLEGTGPKTCRSRHVKRSLSAIVNIAREQASVPGRAVLVWIGPGWPLHSEHGQHTDWFKRSISIMNSIREAQLTFDLVSTTDFEHGKEFRHVDWTAADSGASESVHATAANVAAPVIAHESGGMVFDKSKDMAADIAACLAGADHYYAVSFDAAPSTAANALHSIEVKVNRPNATAHALSLFYAQP